MIDLNSFLYGQVDHLLNVCLGQVEEAFSASANLETKKLEAQRARRAAVTDTLNSQEERLASLIEAADSLIGNKTTTIHRFALGCDAVYKPFRRQEFAIDLTAIAWLHHQLSEHARVAASQDDTLTVGYALKRASDWSNAVGAVGKAIKGVGTSLQGFASSLGGIAALELVITSIIDRAAAEVQGNSPYKRLALTDARVLVANFLARARMDAISGRMANESLPARLDAALAAEATSLIACDGVAWALHFEHYFDEQVALDAKTGLFALIRILFDHGEINGSRLIRWAGDVVEDIDSMAPSKKARNVKIIPTAEMAVAWAVCRLFDGWKPRQPNSDPLTLIDLELPRQDGFAVKVCREIASSILDGQCDDFAFSKPMGVHGAAFFERKDAGGADRPFLGRRTSGRMGGEFVPDALDQPERDVRDVRVNWPGDPARVPRAIRANAILEAAARAKAKK